jgi:hypothetical protein
MSNLHSPRGGFYTNIFIPPLNLIEVKMEKLTYKNRGFYFLGMRLEEDEGFVLYGLEDKLTFKDLNELQTFANMLEITAMNFLSARESANYGKRLKIYFKDGKTRVKYNDQRMTVEKDDLRKFVIILKKLIKKWTWYMASVHLKDLKDGDTLKCRV